MKKILLAVACVIFVHSFSTAQINQWTWISGPQTATVVGTYGTMGVASVNNIPGTRRNGANWTDPQGNLWLFGGYGSGSAVNPAGQLNDLWKFNRSTNEWTWVSGSNLTNRTGIYGAQGTTTAGSTPGSREYTASWRDAAGNFWLFGGMGFAVNGTSGTLNDLWKFEPGTGNWTWVNGDNAINTAGVYGTKGVAAAGNKPGSRYGSATWIDDAGNLYLFGGVGTSTVLNDLWKYNIATNQWTWINGDNAGISYSVYGVKGVQSATNKPGGRGYAATWTDNNGDLWLGEGRGYTESAIGNLNDLWRYNIASNQWTWEHGDKTTDVSGVYGSPGVPAGANKPGSRTNPFYWVDADGNFWIYGGSGYPAAGVQGADFLSDLWKFTVSTKQWTWISGDSTVSGVPVHGTQGVAAPANSPGRKAVGFSFVSSGNLWMFGRENILWKYTISCSDVAAPTLIYNGPSNFCTGDGRILASSVAGNLQWYRNDQVIPGATNQTYTPLISGTYKVAVVAGSCNLPSASVTLSILTSPPSTTITAGGPVSFSEGNSVVLTSSLSTAIQWSANGAPIPGATGQTYTAFETAIYTATTNNGTCNSAPSNAIAVNVALPLSAARETWSEKTALLDDIPSRQNTGMISYNNKLYILSGDCTNQSSYLRDFWEYDPQTKGFTRLPDLPVETSGIIGTSANNKLYFNGSGGWIEYNPATKTFTNKAGFPGTSMHACFAINDSIFAAGAANQFYAYNIVTNTWSARANHPGQARIRSSNFSINGKGYLGGGDNGSTLYVDFYEYNPTTNTWTTKTSIPQSKFLGVSAASATKGYVGAGQSTMGNLPNANWFEYDPIANTWTARANGADAVVRSACAVVNNELFLFSGTKRATNILYNTSFVSRFNITSNAWSTDLPLAGGNRVSANSIFYAGKIYLAGGDDMDYRRDVRAYDIATDSWTKVGDMPGSEASQRAQAIINNKLYLVGGFNNSSQTASGTSEVLEFTPATNSWVTKANYPTGIHSEMAAFSINGYLYAGLGLNGTGAGNQFNLNRFDPVANTWAAMANCPVNGRAAASFAIADTGYVMFYDGTVYAYAPTTNSWQQKATLPIGTGVSAPTSTTKGFALNGKGYFIRHFDFTSAFTELLEYDPTKNTWAFKTSWPVQHHSASATVAGNSVYLGFGFKRYNSSNSMWKLDFSPAISDSLGDANKYYYFQPAQAQSIHDSLGNIIGSLQSKTAASISLKTRRINPTEPLREKFGWFGNNRKQNGIFLNRNFVVTGNIDSATGRFYFLNAEVDSLVSRFNAKHQTNFTVADIKVLHFINQTDLDPLNNFTDDLNNTFTPTLLNTITGSYKNGRWFEFRSKGAGEFYAVLTYLKPSPTTITWTGAANDSLFYSGNNWLPVKIPEFTDTIIVPAAKIAAFKYNGAFATNLIVGDTTGTYGYPNVREAIINGNLDLQGNFFRVNAYGISGKLVVNAGGSLKTAADVYADNKNPALPASLGIINSGSIDAFRMQITKGWLRMQNGIYKSGRMNNDGKLEMTNSLLQNVTELNLLAGSSTIIDSLKVDNTNAHFAFSATPVTLSYPLNVNLKTNNGDLLLQLSGKPSINGSIGINNPTLSSGLTINATDTITLNANVNYANKGDLQINNPLRITGNIIHNGVGDNAVNLNSNVTVGGVFQFNAMNLFQPVIIAGAGNNIFKWPAAIRVTSLTVDKSAATDSISFYNPLAINSGGLLKKGSMLMKPFPVAPNTVVVLGGTVTVAAEAKLVIEK